MAIDPFSPILMMDPLPNCLSMAESATSSALSRSVLMSFPSRSLLVGGWLVAGWWLVGGGQCLDGRTLRKGCDRDPGRMSWVTRAGGAVFERHHCNYEQSFDQAFAQ